MVDELLSVEEAAKILGISLHTVRAWTFQRRLPVVKLGRRCLYRRQDLEALIEKSLRPARSEDEDDDKRRLRER